MATLKNPSVHIKRTDLEKVFGKMEIEIDLDKFLKFCYPYRCSNRVMIRTNAKTKKKLDRVAVDSNADLFNEVLTMYRMEKDHKFIPITPKDSLYLSLVEISADALDFTKLFSYTPREGFLEYIKIGLKLMGRNYALNKFKYYKQRIVEEAQKRTVKAQDTDKKGTALLIDYYFSKVPQITAKGIKELVDKHYHDFVYARMLAEDNGAGIKEWVDVQFQSFEFMNTYPQPNQLHTSESIIRYSKTKPKKTSSKFLRFKENAL